MPRPRREFSPEVISYSELDTLTTCEERWNRRFPDGADAGSAIQLERGTSLHEITGSWWETGELRTAVEVAQTEDLGIVLADDEELDRIDWIARRYAEHYAEWRSDVKVIGTELEVSFDFPYFPIQFHCTIDQVWEFGGEVVVREAKTMADWRRLDLVEVTPQEGLYFYAAQQAGFHPERVFFDAIKTYRWKPQKPTQKRLIEEAERAYESALQADLGQWADEVGEQIILPWLKDDGPWATESTANKRRTAWARLMVEQHPGVDRPVEDSFEYRWLHRTPSQVEGALRWAQGAIARRNDLLFPGDEWTKPLRNIGTECHNCSFADDCWQALSFPALADVIDLDDYRDEVD